MPKSHLLRQLDPKHLGDLFRGIVIDAILVAPAFDH
jgi:hypothetical protein